MEKIETKSFKCYGNGFGFQDWPHFRPNKPLSQPTQLLSAWGANIAPPQGRWSHRDATGFAFTICMMSSCWICGNVECTDICITPVAELGISYELLDRLVVWTRRELFIFLYICMVYGWLHPYVTSNWYWVVWYYVNHYLACRNGWRNKFNWLELNSLITK